MTGGQVESDPQTVRADDTMRCHGMLRDAARGDGGDCWAGHRRSRRDPDRQGRADPDRWLLGAVGRRYRAWPRREARRRDRLQGCRRQGAGPSAEAECRRRQLQCRRRTDRGDQARGQSADRHGARSGLLLGGNARRADPVAAGHRRHLHGLHRAQADVTRPQAGIRRLRPYRVQRQRAGQGGRHLRARRLQGAVGGYGA